jgi:hypothetical protein
VDLELRQLRHFLARAEERNFVRAAGPEHIVQPGLSNSIPSVGDLAPAATRFLDEVWHIRND